MQIELTYACKPVPVTSEMWAAASKFAYDQFNDPNVNIKDGGSGGRERTLSEREKQLREGKCGEFAFIALMARRGFIAMRDTQVWKGGNQPVGHVLGQDIPLLVLPDGKVVDNPVIIDVKTTFNPTKRRWILVEDRRNHADIYVKMGHDTEENQPITVMNWVSITKEREFYDAKGRRWWPYNAQDCLIRWNIADDAVEAVKTRHFPLTDATKLRTEMKTQAVLEDNIYACMLDEKKQMGLPPSMQRTQLHHLLADLKWIYTIASEGKTDT